MYEEKIVLCGANSYEEHIVTESMLKNVFKAEYTKIMSNRNEAWTVTDYYD